MFGLFKKKPKEKTPANILDMNGNPIVEGSVVRSLRYELGECVVELDELEYFYVSRKTGQRISYTKMVDAITENQKVLLLDSNELSK